MDRLIQKIDFQIKSKIILVLSEKKIVLFKKSKRAYTLRHDQLRFGIIY